ncbi:MAG: bis(5'-nucleosyl)-tetraphosphatase (symmetrical) YqeK [Clostridia bacterium]|nr:bis(5'-nucleosyl)-tetraphosphatase (symmetrical) YqeK [Clostridia bacterium]
MIWSDEKIIEVIRDRLVESRFVHSLNVADSARDLAVIYGADADICYTAGLLHDITKNAPQEEHFNLFEKGNVILTQAENANHKLWHAMSGEQFIRQNTDIKNEEIWNAVRYHTTGRAGMSLVEKIIYIADFVSAERDYPDVDVMRALSVKSLDDAMLYSLRYTIPDLIKKGQTIHPDSVNLYNELISLKKG